LPNAQSTTISTARFDDLPDVLALLRQCALLEGGVAHTIGDFCVARASGLLVGCAGLEIYGEAGLLRSVAVQASMRQVGLGTKLVDAIVSKARSRGLGQLFLLTTTAAAFFETRGFCTLQRSAVPAQIAECWEFRVGCPQSAVAMRFELKEA
jgi:amino-acid N-acetyltransferase